MIWILYVCLRVDAGQCTAAAGYRFATERECVAKLAENPAPADLIDRAGWHECVRKDRALTRPA